MATFLISERSGCGIFCTQGQERLAEGRLGAKSKGEWWEDSERETKGLG